MQKEPAEEGLHSAFHMTVSKVDDVYWRGGRWSGPPRCSCWGCMTVLGFLCPFGVGGVSSVRSGVLQQSFRSWVNGLGLRFVLRFTARYCLRTRVSLRC